MFWPDDAEPARFSRWLGENGCVAAELPRSSELKDFRRAARGRGFDSAAASLQGIRALGVA
jgi:hypothetical protein